VSIVCCPQFVWETASRSSDNSEFDFLEQLSPKSFSSNNETGRHADWTFSDGEINATHHEALKDDLIEYRWTYYWNLSVVWSDLFLLFWIYWNAPKYSISRKKHLS
jgi:hypothetical protein